MLEKQYEIKVNKKEKEEDIKKTQQNKRKVLSKNTKKSLTIIVLVIFACIVNTVAQKYIGKAVDVFLEHFNHFSQEFSINHSISKDKILTYRYWITASLKVSIFLLTILFYFILTKDDNILCYLKKPKKLRKTTRVLILLTFLTITIGYLISSLFFDYKQVVTGLKEQNITLKNFKYIFVYIVFINSLLEEIFFRGFANILLAKYIGENKATIFSSLMFAIYHIAIMESMFNIGMMVLLVVGLFIVGFIFSYLNNKNKNIYNSYLVHMVANITLNAIALLLLNIY